MLFNSYEFLFLFLPIVLVIFAITEKLGQHRIAIVWLVAASLFFYGWWNPAYLGLIAGSMIFNYLIGTRFGKRREGGQQLVLLIGVAANLGLLGYYKYANFFVDNLGALIGSDFHLETIILPLAISFFTFQQIAYLVDAYRGETNQYGFLHYCLFVTFFPQLIAGPIVHHKEMLPQFARGSAYKIGASHLAVGITIFALGLFKKVILADNAAVYATPVFSSADAGATLGFVEAWTGTLAYTFQLYFDFSGYSDMAIGVARMFGIRLPLNFNSPYRSTSIIDFWRRWHMTLSRFLRDYLYIPLGGSRKGKYRRHVNLFATMVLGGLWHGAGWNFVLWGMLHGSYLIINHSWRSLFSGSGATSAGGKAFGWFVTFLAAVFAWVPFRAETTSGALTIWSSMVGWNGWASEHTASLFHGYREMGLLIILSVIALIFPNTQQFMRRYRPAFETYKGEIAKLRYRQFEWRPSFPWAILSLGVLVAGVLGLSQVSEFLYFQF